MRRKNGKHNNLITDDIFSMSLVKVREHNKRKFHIQKMTDQGSTG